MNSVWGYELVNLAQDTDQWCVHMNKIMTIHIKKSTFSQLRCLIFPMDATCPVQHNLVY
jgi:hypothetical protein